MLKGGAILPHAPLIALRGDPAAAAIADAATSAWDEIAAWGCPVVLISPHGSATGVTTSGDGDLDGFGLAGISVVAEVDLPLAGRIAEGWGAALGEDRLDHGAVGALVHASPPPPVVSCVFAETTGPAPPGDLTTVRSETKALADVLAAIAADTEIGVVVSAHSAASLTPAAPLTQRSEGRAFDDALLDALATDNGAIGAIDAALWERGGTCSTGPLLVWAHLFTGRSSDVHAYDAPAGVGYFVATCS